MSATDSSSPLPLPHPQADSLESTSASTAGRKKFATPPVKIACLACRASRTRCDGGKPCTSCRVRTRGCEYRPSRRGGARRRKVKVPEEQLDQLQLQDALPVPQDPMDPEGYIVTGAGLARLPDLEWIQDSDYIFNSLLQSMNHGTGPDVDIDAEIKPLPAVPLSPIPMVRTYKDDASLLEAYYVFIHPYFPILPPPAGIPQDRPNPRLQNELVDSGTGGAFFEPTSSLGLSIAAMLALIPCSQDPCPSSQESVLFRRRYAQYLAQAAIETVEAEDEMPESSLSPPKALEDSVDFTGGDFDQGGPSPAASGSSSAQPRFHPGVPRQLESIAALDLLSVYEYAQRGNIKKMQSRAGQALVAAMAQGLHDTAVDDEYTEARRRVWWMTYVSVSQGSIVGNCAPTFDVFRPSFKTKFPTIQSDPESFIVFIQGQEAMIAATKFFVELTDVMTNKRDPTHLYQTMHSLERFLEPLNSVFESWVLPSHVCATVDPTEEVLGRSLRALAMIKLTSARIKLHRYSAFFDTPIFTSHLCDLKPMPVKAAEACGNGHGHALHETCLLPACACFSQRSPSTTMSASSTSPDSFSPGSTAASVAGAAASSPLTDGISANSSQYALPLAPYTFVMPSYHAKPAGGMPGMNNGGNYSNYSGNGNGNSGGGDGCGSAPAAFQLAFPFTSHESVRICLLSALNLAQALEDMPYPIPDPVSSLPSPPAQRISSSGTFNSMDLNMGLDLTSLDLDFAAIATGSTAGFFQAPPHAGDSHHALLQSFSPPLQPQTPFLLAPRTMPSFACCTMQCAYALLMVYRRTAAIYYGTSGGGTNPATGGGGGGAAGVASGAGAGGGGGTGQPLAGSLLIKLQQGLASVLASLENYALAYEALGGMRDQVRTAIESIAARRPLGD